MVMFVAALCVGRVAHAGLVTDCGDGVDATTTLRGKVASASDSETVDVSQCATIALMQGPISTALNLTIQGPIDGQTLIDASGLGNRAFLGTGASTTLVLSHLVVAHAHAPGLGPYGGCVLGTNQITLQNTTLTDCAATSNDNIAQGGAVNAPKVALISSVITDSIASSANAEAQGGAAYGDIQITCENSLVQGNQALAGGGNPSGPLARGGGLFSNSVSLNGCALVSNHASHTGGGVFASFFYMLNSTVSGNSVDFKVGGIAAATAASISNSTIAFNQGGTCGGLIAPSNAYINSSIIANNTATTATACHEVNAGFGSGADNIVGVADDGVTLGTNTHVGDPQLSPLGYHGGLTPTHAFTETSLAYRTGNNANMFDTDQRGTGYPRETGGITDIGAYQRQAIDDEIFYDGME